MIVNFPTYNELEEMAICTLTEAFCIAYKVYSDSNKIRSWKEDFFKHRQKTLCASFMLYYESIEYFMKSAITKVTPLLLLNVERNKWGSNPNNSTNKDFNEFYIISGEDLINTYFALPKEILNINNLTEKKYTKNIQKIYNFMDNMRIKRNKIVHSVFTEDLTSDYIIKNILQIYLHFCGQDIWWEIIKDYFYSDPDIYYMQMEDFDVKARLIQKLDYIETILGKIQLRQYFSYTGRKYCCPECSSVYNELNIESKWAFLHPNKPNSKKIHCLICGEDFEIHRIKCSKPGCKGNVIYENVCLTCLYE
ncbi:MAG: hypothetical protein ABRQ39_31405 [Candidatus Eremiobacterota bacterium]